MARIRSIHPGQTTDEDFVECRPMARLLAIHIRCEVDDHGVFPWRPKTIKMRIFPADDNVKVEKLLADLEAHNQIKSVEVDGKRYGVIRNFGKWQSPKKPTYQHPTTPEMLAYAGFADDESAGLYPDSIPASSESYASSELAPPSAIVSSEPVRNRFGIFPAEGRGRGRGRGKQIPTYPPYSPPPGGESAKRLHSIPFPWMERNRNNFCLPSLLLTNHPPRPPLAHRRQARPRFSPPHSA